MSLECSLASLKGQRILIAGPGYVGGLLAKELYATGVEVHTISRSKKVLPDGIQQNFGDLSQRETYQNLAGNFSNVFYLAGADSRTEKDYQKVYLDGPELLITYIEESSKNSRLIFSSSTSVYGQNDGERVDEGSPTEPNSFSGKIILEAEKQILHRHRDSLIVRFSGIYGPNRDRLVRTSLNLENSDLVSTAFTNRIHQSDCSRLLQHLISVPSTDRVFIGSDCNPAPRIEVINWIRKKNGLSQLHAKRKIPGELNKRCSNKKIIDSGFKFLHQDYQSGYSLQTHQN